MTLFKINNKYYFKDPCNRHWELTPIYNGHVMMPFITKPISEEKFIELLKECGGHVVG